MKILVIQGPNLNRLGRRDPATYGHATLAELTSGIDAHARALGLSAEQTQSNHEGLLVDWLHERIDADDPAAQPHGLVINPASLTPVGRSLAQAVAESGLPTAVVHISSVHRHAESDRVDLFAKSADVEIIGCGTRGYIYALDELAAVLDAPARRAGEPTAVTTSNVNPTTSEVSSA